MDRRFSDKLSWVQREAAIKKFQELKSPDHRVFLLLGSVGAGKSSFVNFLAGEPVVEIGDGFYGVTTESSWRDIQIQGRWLRIVDVPGSFDPLRNQAPDVSDNGYLTKECNLMNAEFIKALLAAGPEIHAVGLVVNIDERSSLKVQLMIGLLHKLKIGMKHVVVIFTHGDSLLPTPPSTDLRRRYELKCESLRHQIDGLECLTNLLAVVDERYIVVENTQLCERSNIMEQLSGYIENIAADPMTNDTYQNSLQWWKEQQANRKRKEQEEKGAKDKLAKLRSERDKTDLEKLRSTHRSLESECSDLSSKLSRAAEMEKMIAELRQIEQDTDECTDECTSVKEKLRCVNEEECTLNEQGDTLKKLKGKIMPNFDEKTKQFKIACIDVTSTRDEGIATLEDAADEIIKLMIRSSAAKVSGYTASIVGGAIFTVGTGLLIGSLGTIAPAAIPLMAIGGAVGVVGSATAIGGTIGHLVKKSKIVKRANEWLKGNKEKCEGLIRAHDSLSEEYTRIREFFPCINAELPPGMAEVGEIVTTWKKIMQHSAAEATQVVVIAASSGAGIAQGVLEGLDAGLEIGTLGVKSVAKAAGGVAIGLSALVMLVDLGLLVKSSVDLDRARKGKSRKIKTVNALQEIAKAVRDENNLLREAFGAHGTSSLPTGDPAASVVCNSAVVTEEQLQNGCVDEFESDSNHEDECLATSSEQVEGVNHDGDDVSMISLEPREGEDPSTIYVPQSTDSNSSFQLNVQEDSDTQSDTDLSDSDSLAIIGSNDNIAEADTSDTHNRFGCIIS